MKLTLEEKRRIIVEEHLRDKIPLNYLAVKYNCSRGTLDFLKRRYLLHGDSVFEKQYRKFSEEYKISCVELVLKHGECLAIAAVKSNVEVTTLKSWITKYQENDGKIEDMKKKKTINVAILNNDKTTEELLEENLRLRAENAYLKKLRSLIQQEDESHK